MSKITNNEKCFTKKKKKKTNNEKYYENIILPLINFF